MLGMRLNLDLIRRVSEHMTAHRFTFAFMVDSSTVRFPRHPFRDSPDVNGSTPPGRPDPPFYMGPKPRIEE